MNEQLARTFNEEIERYKNALLFYAKKCEWDTFKINAGKLFDYIESIEMSEIEKKFLKISKVVIAILFLAVVIICRINPDIYPGLIKIKKVMTLSAVGGCSFELYFFLNFSKYMEQKMSFYKKRRERFISNIERDFREIIVPATT